MGKEIRFDGGRVIVDPPKRPKKITGTRFGAVLESNKWQTPFQAWCEITKAYQKPFEDTIYTIAGKEIEDKQLKWFARYLPVIRPEDVYGKDFFDKTYGDFFPKEPVFGGMWDSLVGESIDAATGVIECKTTKRAEDWKDDVPEYYALQAALYAHLLHLDDVYMIVTFLEEKDYEKPKKFKCTTDNTTYVHFKVSERYPKFQSYIEYCMQFWHEHVKSGISPLFDEKKDKEYLDALRTNVVSDESEVDALVREAEQLYAHIEEVNATIAADDTRLKEIESLLKKFAIENWEEGQNKTEFKGSSFTWDVSKSVKKSVDTDKMKENGIYEEYLTESESYTIRKSKNKGEANK